MKNIINIDNLLGGALRRASNTQNQLTPIVKPILDEQTLANKIKTLKFLKGLGINLEALTCIFLICFIYFLFRKMDQDSYKKDHSNLFEEPKITEIDYNEKNKNRIALQKEMESVHLSFVVFLILTIVFGFLGTIVSQYAKISLRKLEK
jgi:hypothetical protein